MGAQGSNGTENYILSNLGCEILAQVSTEVTASEARPLWACLPLSHAPTSSTRAWSLLRRASTISEYFAKMKGMANDMESTGHRLEDEELVSYILTGLDLEFNLVVSAVATRMEPISVGDLYTQLVAFEQRMELHGGGGGQQSSANVDTKGGHGGNNDNARGSRGNGRDSGRGHKGDRGGGRSPRGASSGVMC